MSRQPQNPFALNLTAAMTRAGFSISRLARDLGVPERTVTRWRAGESEPSFDTRRSISEALGRGADTSWMYAEPEAKAA